MKHNVSLDSIALYRFVNKYYVYTFVRIFEANMFFWVLTQLPILDTVIKSIIRVCTRRVPNVNEYSSIIIRI